MQIETGEINVNNIFELNQYTNILFWHFQYKNYKRDSLLFFLITTKPRQSEVYFMLMALFILD